MPVTGFLTHPSAVVAIPRASPTVPVSVLAISYFGVRSSLFPSSSSHRHRGCRSLQRVIKRRDSNVSTPSLSVTSPSPQPSTERTPGDDRGNNSNTTTSIPQNYQQERQSGSDNDDVTVVDTAIAASLTSEPEHPMTVHIPIQLHVPVDAEPMFEFVSASSGNRHPGVLPSCLQGLRLLRMGPGVFDGLLHSDGLPFAVGHWYDGLGVLHDFQFSYTATPMLSYRSRSLADHITRTVRATPRWQWLELSFGSKGSGGPRSMAKKIHDLVISILRPTLDPVTKRPPHPNVPILLQHVGPRGLSARTDASISLRVLLDSMDSMAEKEEGGNGDGGGGGEGRMATGIQFGEFFTFEDIDSRLTGVLAASLAGVDKHTGDLYNFIFGLDDMDSNGHVKYTVFCVPAKAVATDKREAAQVLTTFRAPPVYMHSVGLTPNYVIITMGPMVFRPLRLLLERCLTHGMDFDRTQDTVFRIVHRETGVEANRVLADATFLFHIVNTFESRDAHGGATIVLDVSSFDDGLGMINAMELHRLRAAKSKHDFPDGKLVRYMLPLLDAVNHDNGGSTAESVAVRARTRMLYDGYLDVPCVAPVAVNDPKYRYVYAVAHDRAVFDSIVKIDVICGAIVDKWVCDNGVAAVAGDAVVGEPVFVAHDRSDRRAAAGGDKNEDEDDGVLLVVTVERATGAEASDGKEWMSRLVVLCAKKMQLIATATIPYVVPLGYRGTVLHPPAKGNY